MRSTGWLLLLVATAVLSTSAMAKSKSDIRDVTGCLSKGNSADEFMLNGDDGSMWEVKSSRVNLGKHERRCEGRGDGDGRYKGKQRAWTFEGYKRENGQCLLREVTQLRQSRNS